MAKKKVEKQKWYVEKAYKIKETQKKREERLKLEAEEIRKKILEKQQKHKETYDRVKQETAKEIEMLQEKIWHDANKEKHELDVIFVHKYFVYRKIAKNIKIIGKK